jgi:hypothetical protein
VEKFQEFISLVTYVKFLLFLLYLFDNNRTPERCYDSLETFLDVVLSLKDIEGHLISFGV